MATNPYPKKQRGKHYVTFIFVLPLFTC